MTAYTCTTNNLPDGPGYATGDTLTTADGFVWTYREGSGWLGQSSVSGDPPAVTAAQIVAGTLGSYTADTTYLTADTSGGVDKGTLVRWDSSRVPAAWVFDFYRSSTVL